MQNSEIVYKIKLLGNLLELHDENPFKVRALQNAYNTLKKVADPISTMAPEALGATQQTIKNQFLIESIVICVFGGSIGILLGIIIGNLISMALDTGFFVPWFWMMSGYAICVIVC